MAEDAKTPEILIPKRAMGCACANLRQASRAITQMFDEALRPAGIRATQLGILFAARAADGGVSLSQLADALVMDRTTLARNLGPLERDGLIKIEAEPGDRRKRTILLQPAGEDVIARALPLWQEVQSRVVEGLGPDHFHTLLDGLDRAVALSRGDS